MTPLFRAGTIDEAIWQSVHDADEYRLPADMTGAVVLDVGAHIGACACLCKTRGAAAIWAVEPDLGSLRLCMANVAATPGAAILQPIHAAAWRSDRRGDRVYARGYEEWRTDCPCIEPMAEGEAEVPALPLDDLVTLATDWGRRRLTLLKLDCEGSEWPILFTSRTLHLIDAIVGEYHLWHADVMAPLGRVPGLVYDLGSLRSRLEAEGFTVEIDQPEEPWGLFRARRPQLSP